MKKTLSLVLVLALVLGSFGMVFAAAPTAGLTDIDASANAEAIQVVNDLGIVTGYEDNTFGPEKNVTRAEFAAMITRALAIPESALAGYAQTNFKDVAGAQWAVKYLAFCESKGIMLGDGNGNVMPSNTITVNEAMTMVLRALGYTSNSSVLTGTWPANYVTLAQNNGLYDDVKATNVVNRESAAQVIYNALTVAKVAVNADGETTTLVEKAGDDYVAVTLLTSGLDCEVVDAAIITGEEDSVINLVPYIGAVAVTYLNDDEEIVAMGDIKTTFLTGDFNDETNKFEVGDVDYTILGAKIATDGTDSNNDYDVAAVKFENTDVDSTWSAPSKVEANTFVDGSGAGLEDLTLAVELSGKTIKTIYSVSTWDLDSTYMFDDGDLDLDDNTLCAAQLPEDDDDAIDYDAFQLLGVADLEKIAEDNVVCIYLNDEDEIVKVTVGTKTVEGKVAMVDGTTFTIAGVDYDLADGGKAPKLGEEGTAYLTYDGEIYDWDKTSGSTDNYAIVLGSSAGNDIDNDKVKILTKTGDEVTYEVDEDAYATGAAIANFAKGTLITYSLDKDGIIDEINKLTGTQEYKDKDFTAGKVSKSGSIWNGQTVDSDVVVFTADNAKLDAADFDVTTIADVDKDDAFTPIATYKNEDQKIAVMIINEDNSASDYVYAVVNKVITAENEDGDNVQYVTGFADGKAFSAYTEKSNTIDLAQLPVAKSAATPTLVVFDVNAAGEITAVKQVLTGAVAGDAAYFDDVTVVSGEVKDKDGTDVTVGGTVVSVDANAKVYLLDDAKTKDAAYVAKSVNSLKKGNIVYMWQIDDDSEYYDIVLYLEKAEK